MSERMTGQQRQNALHLLDVLENQLTDAQCDMGHWVIRPLHDGPLPPREQRGNHQCGTAACLAGWGALLLAPTEDESAVALTGHRVSLRVPTDLARRIWERVYGGDLPPSRIYKDTAEVPVEDIGAELLGPEIAAWFDDAEGPRECHMKDRQWMIAVLRKELHLSYDHDLSDRDERHYGYDPDYRGGYDPDDRGDYDTEE